MNAWVDLALMLLTFLLTFFVNVEVSGTRLSLNDLPAYIHFLQIGIVISLGLSLALCVKQSAVMRIKILGRIPGTQLYEALDDEDDDSPYPGEEIPGVLIVRIRDVSLTFGRFYFLVF